MKYLIYFLLFSTIGFSQNYQYAIQKAPVTQPEAPVSKGVNNQLEEIEYFKSYLLPIAKKATLQSALDTYGSVRLEKGDYSGVNIVMRSNQRLYGHPTLTQVSSITIAAGSSNVHLEDLYPVGKDVIFQAGGVISNCTLKTIKYANIKATNAMIENNLLINIISNINFDCSGSGYFRNNKIIKHQVHSTSNMLVMKGNTSTPSYGNVHLHTNFLTSHGDTTELDGLKSATFVGIDAEGWNLMGQGSKAMFTAKNIDNLKLTDFGGANAYSAVATPSFDIDAKDVFFLNKDLRLPTDIVSTRANMFMVNGQGTYVRKPGTVTGFDLLGNLDDSKALKYNGVEQTSTMTNSTVINTISNTILGTQGTPWARPNWETLPDPLGPNWKADRVGKPDQTSYIQGLINNDGIAELPEGVYYIKSTLKIPIDFKHGIVGQGSGKTVIVGLTDDFPLISLTGGTVSNFILSNLTLQGGSTGIYSSQDYGLQFIAFQNLKFVVFRNQNYGVHIKQIAGCDNNFFENLGFVDCNIGFFQDPRIPYINNDVDTSSYIDKTMFYRNQFINCGTAVSMVPTRPNNLDAWVDCKFDGGQIALSTAGNFPTVANCDFTNYNGTNVIKSASISIYNTNVYNNNVTGSTISALSTSIEGCKFLDNAPMFSPIMFNTISNHIVNSVITGDVVVNVPVNKGYGKESSTYVNSTLSSNPSLSKLLVNVKSGVPTVIINTTPTPYPQLLVTQ